MVRVERCRDIAWMNGLLNHPRVRPWVAYGDHEIDITPQITNPKNIFLAGEHGVCGFMYIAPGTYEVHTVVMPEHRGQWTNELTEAAGNHMFLATDAFEIVTRVPKGHLGAKTAAIARGMRYEFTREKECVFLGRRTDVHIYGFRIQDWIVSADFLEEAGRLFHDELHRQADLLGVEDEAHGNDPNHNKYVGAAIAMARNGQVRKGVLFYNRWAMMCRHEPIFLLQAEPHPIVRIDHGLIVELLPGGNIEVSRHDTLS